MELLTSILANLMVSTGHIQPDKQWADPPCYPDVYSVFVDKSIEAFDILKTQPYSWALVYKNDSRSERNALVSKLYSQEGNKNFTSRCYFM